MNLKRYLMSGGFLLPLMLLSYSAAAETPGDKLFKAIEEGNPEKAEQAFAEGASAKTTYHGMSALHHAANWGDVEIVKMLIARGADVNAKDSEGATALTQWAGLRTNTQYEIVKLLVQAGIDVNSHNRNGSSALIIFSGLGDPEENRKVVKVLIEGGANVEADGGLALVNAAYYHASSEIVKMLIQAGANVNTFAPVYYENGHPQLTPLMAAATAWHKPRPNDQENIRLLVAAGADVNARKDTGEEYNALYVAAANGNAQIFTWLLDSGAKLDVPSKEAFKALTVSAQEGDSVLARRLLEAGVDPNGAYLALHEASGLGHIEVVRLLLSHGAKVNAHAPYNGSTPLHYAVGYNMNEFSADNAQITQLLLQTGADPNVSDKFGATPLMYASVIKPGEANAIESLKLLLQYGANVQAQSETGQTALGIALKAQNQAAIEILSQVRGQND